MMTMMKSVHIIPTTGSSVRLPKREEPLSCSTYSILGAMERFVRSVDDMDSAVMVPRRLLDVKLEDDPNVHSSLGEAGVNVLPKRNRHGAADDLYVFYNLLNQVKNQLLWGPGRPEAPCPTASAPGVVPARSKSGHTTPQRRPSLTSLSSNSSINSPTTPSSNPNSSASLLGVSRCTSNMSDNDSDTSGSVNSEECLSQDGEDSGVENEEDGRGPVHDLADSFQMHLDGLYRCLGQLSQAANYVSQRYVQDVEGGMTQL